MTLKTDEFTGMTVIHAGPYACLLHRLTRQSCCVKVTENALGGANCYWGLATVKKPRELPGRRRQALAAVAVSAVVAASVTVAFSEPNPFDLIALPQAVAQPAPTGPTGGGSGGGFDGPPFPMQPPGIPDGPGAYNSGSYPAPDQSWGIDIYQTGAQAPSGSRGGYNQAPDYPQQLQPANGTQPPDYDAPPQQPQSAPRGSSAPNSPVVRRNNNRPSRIRHGKTASANNARRNPRSNPVRPHPSSRAARRRK